METNQVALTNCIDRLEKRFDLLANLIIDSFNPPDEVDGEVQIYIRAVERARDYVRSIPCLCFKGLICDRCLVLGRAKDTPIER